MDISCVKIVVVVCVVGVGGVVVLVKGEGCEFVDLCWFVVVVVVVGDGYGGGLMGGVCDDFDIIWVKVGVCDGFGGGVKDGWDVVFGLNMGGDCRGGWECDGGFLDVVFKDLVVCWGCKMWRRGEGLVGRGWGVMGVFCVDRRGSGLFCW